MDGKESSTGAPGLLTITPSLLDRRTFLKGAGALSAGALFLGVNPIPVLSQERKQETPEFQAALGEVVTLLTKTYTDNKPTTLEVALARQRDIAEKILGVFGKHTLAISGSGGAIGQAMETLRVYGYVLAISPMAIGQDRFVVNAPLHKIDTVTGANLSMFEFPDLTPLNERVAVHAVSRTLVPDVRETEHSPVPRMTFSGMTLTDVRGDSTVLIFEERVRTIARRDSLTIEHFRETVVANELAQVYLVRVFARDFPDAGFLLGLPLSTFGISMSGKNFTVNHLIEAFSDWGSIKHGKTFSHELTRILQSSAEHYGISHAIAAAAMGLVIKDRKFAVLRGPGSQIDLREIRNLTPTQLDELKQIILENYEVNLKGALARIVQSLPTLRRIYESQKQKR